MNARQPPGEHHHDRNKGELPRLDAEIEEQKRERNRMLRQADSLSAPAKPRPCNSPKVKATSHGHRTVRLDRPRREFTISAATKTMESAIAASTGRAGTCTKPSVAAASVMLCATVKAVTVRATRRHPRTRIISASTNSR